MMQEIFNPNPDGKKKEVHWNETVYRIGDKVLQLVNSPEDNVFNGDMGQIVGITYAKNSEDKVDELTIQFDANEVTYKRNEWNKITLSYCCSIHKAQGSEFKMVILPMVHQYQRMLQRNLLYTAITRSKELLILLGELPAYQQCVENESNLRYTTLKERILGIDTLSTMMRQRINQYEEADEEPFVEEIEAVEPVVETIKEDQTSLSLFVEEEKEALPEYLTEDIVRTGQIDPMIGMEGISPYDFQMNELNIT
jgi:exodeoxyribonuclease V alpha subunit